MNKKQWLILIVGIICVIIFIGIATGSKPYRGNSNIFWTAKMYTSKLALGGELTHWIHTFNYPPFILLLFVISGIFGFIIWSVKTKDQESRAKVPKQKITISEEEEQIPPEKNFIEKLKELAALKEKGLISEEEFKEGKVKLFGETNEK